MIHGNLFSIATKQLQYLNSRQFVVAQNIANLSTPGYKAVESKPFQDFLRRTESGLTMTDLKHISYSGSVMNRGRNYSHRSDHTSVSGNNVNVETELMKSGEIRKMFDANASVYKAFHKMFLNVVKG